MGVYIKGMEMPKSCRYCEFRHMSLTQNAFCTAAHETINYVAERTKRLDNCPLVPVPPHGRLIDIDAPYQIQVHVDGLTKKGGVDIYAPTVLDADWAEEGE